MTKTQKHIFFVLVLVLFAQSMATHKVFAQSPETYRTFDAGFKERYTSDKYNYEGKKIVGRTKRGSGEYEDYDKEKTKTKEQDNEDALIINFGPLGWVFVLILIAAVVYLAYVLLNEGGTGFFGASKNKSITRYDDINAENIEHANIQTLIKNAENDKDYRLAIRYYYLLVLKTLSIKNYIKFEDDKTNADYLNEINGKPFSKDFSYTSYLYNYIWYGKFSLEEQQYQKAKNNFTTLLNQVK